MAGCPEGRVLYLGRNLEGFGRMSHCDLLPVELFGQGGATIRLNIEARCINSESNVRVRFKLKTSSDLIFDRARVFEMSQR
ncbi:MAG: hypothetical protein MK133_14700, partial [Planctomycetes bacterium]|nr:hypothetical protein [Planctomycetota bacterium]